VARPGVAVAAESPDLVAATASAPVDLRATAAPAAPPSPVAPPPDDGRALVLVVEDNPDMNRFVRECLAGDYRTAGAFDGREGLARAAELRPDLVVSDVMMPGMSGDELLAAMRARPELAKTPVVLVTAKTDDEFRVRLLREGAQDFLIKPFSAEELRARVRNLVLARRADESVRRLNAELSAANDELEAFSYSVSHDLRAPLRHVSGFIDLLNKRAGAALDAESHRYLDTISRAALHMGRLIDDLLVFSRAGRAEMRLARVNLAALVAGVVVEARRGAADREIEWVIGALPAVDADTAMLRQALVNLLENAVKYTRPAAHARIEVGHHLDGAEHVFHVRDNGVGFDMRYADKLFGVFQRLHRAEDFEGTGIGLANVRRIVGRHGGRTWAEGAVGSGATFYFSLPAQERRGSVA